MLNSDLTSPFNRVVFVIIGLMLIGWGTGALWRVSLMYQSWWKGSVFGPFAIAIGILFIAVTFKLGSLEQEAKGKKHHKSR
jgi:hypothetical protein